MRVNAFEGRLDMAGEELETTALKHVFVGLSPGEIGEQHEGHWLFMLLGPADNYREIRILG